MIGRIEILLLLLIAFFATRTLYTQTVYESRDSSHDTKQLALKKAHIIEINQTAVLSEIEASGIIKNSNNILFGNLKLTSDDVYLTADRATQEGDVILLEKNIMLSRRGGTSYYADDARYNRRNRVLDLRGEFRIEDRLGTTVGHDMIYDQNPQSIRGDSIKANYTIE